ncbi:MAG: flagellar biosynthesis anti-sigma factor FlgM [Bacillota bacterium]
MIRVKVNQTQVQGVLGAYGRQQVNKPKQAEVKAAAPAPADKPADAVELSPEARELAAVKQRLAEVPDVREQRVAELAAKVQSGTYRVPAQDVARRILDLGL